MIFKKNSRVFQGFRRSSKISKLFPGARAHLLLLGRNGSEKGFGYGSKKIAESQFM